MKKRIVAFITLIFSDVITIFICFLLAYLIRIEFLPSLFNRFEETIIFTIPNYLNYSYLALVWPVIFFYKNLYTKRFFFWEEVKVLLKGTTLSSALVLILILISKRKIPFSIALVILLWISSLFLFPLFRLFTKNLLMRMSIWKKKLIILGTNETSFSLFKGIIQNRTLGYEILGFLEDTPQNSKEFHGAEILGAVSEFENLVKTHDSKDIMIAMPDFPKEKLNQLIMKCEGRCESLWIVPRIGDILTTGVELESIGRVLGLRTKKNLEKPWNKLFKIIFDMCLSFLLIFLLLPFFVIIGVAVKLDSKGSILYIQKRLGKKKRLFNLYKFRSMYTDSEEKLGDYIKDHPAAKEEWEKFKKLKNFDPRVTRVGEFIRKYSLDELPQLYNVIQGKMSIVGPRPYLAEEIDGEDTFKLVVTKVRPGITGLWQISGRSDLFFEERLELDEYYIRNWDVWLDITILFKSIKVWLSKKGAY
jgi:Undecaprenyl-phosphate galactose phosphotransferase WbaP